MTKPSLPQGTRDFAAVTVYKRNYILNTIRSVFELYGFEPLETPAMENLETLMGKYGEEGDKLIFKILNNGLNDPKNIEKANDGFAKLMEGKNTASLTERALKYDLTIPFARYVAMNANTLTMPYKRYQMQQVWRADRPQKGRYREFTQCDADVVGSTSLINEVELCGIYDKAFQGLGINAIIKINSRKILQGIADFCGCSEMLITITTAIDKIEKIGIKGVLEELKKSGIAEKNAALIFECLNISDQDFNEQICLDCMEYYDESYSENKKKLICLKSKFINSNITNGLKGIEEIEYIIDHTEKNNNNFKSTIEFDLSLARGLNYYTGIIFEVKAPAVVKMGSIGGGGRYDNLTGLFGVPDRTGVGISFGIDRIYDVMEELNLFNKTSLDVNKTKILILNHGEMGIKKSLSILNVLRKKNIPSEIYPDNHKMDKQYKYAEHRKISLILDIKSEFSNSSTFSLKRLNSHQSVDVTLEQLILLIKKARILRSSDDITLELIRRVESITKNK